MYHLGVDRLTLDSQMSEADRQAESPRSSATRIYIKNSTTLLNQRLVGMATDYNVKTGIGGIYVNLFQVMYHVDGDGSNFRHLPNRKFFCPLTLIIITANRDNWGNTTQSFKHMRFTDVAGVKNHLDP